MLVFLLLFFIIITSFSNLNEGATSKKCNEKAQEGNHKAYIHHIASYQAYLWFKTHDHITCVLLNLWLCTDALNPLWLCG